jgi:sulfate/thiosulfate transport system ATP-binding protein
MSIEVKNINKTFGQYTVLKDVSLKVATGELVALLGPSGCGKTTLLRIIAGLDEPDEGSGSILFDEGDVSALQTGQRRVGFVFQHYSLFRHMNIFENVAFGLKARPKKERPSKKDIQDKVFDLLKLVQLERVATLYPSQLSGGQRQRVALIRALAVEPKILLLDEPFGALDAKVRKELRRWLRRLHDQMHVTSVFVTHDQEEALEVADKVAVMNEGIIAQIGTPEEVYDRPASPFVYNFLGNVNLFHGRLHGGGVQIDEGAQPDSGSVLAYVRPHDVEISRLQDGKFTIPAKVIHVSAAGSIARIQLVRLDTGEPVEAELARERYRSEKYVQGEQVYIRAGNPHVFVQDYTI